MKELRGIAKSKGLPMAVTEGGGHTKVVMGDVIDFVPRHREVAENTAKSILKKFRSA